MPALTERLVAHAAAEWPMSAVCSRVVRQHPALPERLPTHQTSVWLCSAVDSPVHSEAAQCRVLFAADAASKRFLAGMTSPVSCKVMVVETVPPALGAPVFTSVNVHVVPQAAVRRKTPVAFAAWIPFLLVTTSAINTFLSWKPLALGSGQTWPDWPVIRWIISAIFTAISCSLHLTATFTCITCTNNSSKMFNRKAATQGLPRKFPLPLATQAPT